MVKIIYLYFLAKYINSKEDPSLTIFWTFLPKNIGVSKNFAYRTWYLYIFSKYIRRGFANLLLIQVSCFFLIFVWLFVLQLNTSLNYFNCTGASKSYTYFGKPVFGSPKTLHYFVDLQYGTVCCIIYETTSFIEGGNCNFKNGMKRGGKVLVYKREAATLVVSKNDYFQQFDSRSSFLNKPKTINLKSLPATVEYIWLWGNSETILEIKAWGFLDI